MNSSICVPCRVPRNPGIPTCTGSADTAGLLANQDLPRLDALEQKTEAAFYNLYKSIECGFKDVDYLMSDPHFEGMHADPRWKVVAQCISGRK